MIVLALFIPLAFAQSSVNIEEGRRWYNTQCATCHGVKGDGGRGALLATPKLRRGTNDSTLRNIITRGIPGTEMPRSPLTAQQIANVAAYVRTLGQVVPTAVHGNAAQGRVLFEGKGACSRCHTRNGTGGPLGPDLSNVGARTSPGYLRISLTDPSAAVPPGFFHITASTRTGQKVEGVRIDEDTFSIRMRDLTGTVQSYWKVDLVQFKKDRQSPMPSYAKSFTNSELDDLVSYLVTLQ